MKTLFNHRTVLIIVFALLCNTCAKDTINIFGGISGTVRDEQQQPIEGVSVSLNPGGVTKSTGKDGSYSFIDLESKQYTLAYSKNEYLPASKETTVQAGMNNVIDVTLEKEQLVPVLAVSAQSLNFGAEQTTISLDVSNTGKGALNWTITHTPSWFTCSPAIGTTAAGGKSSVVVTASRSQKEKGTYRETFSISSNGGSCDVTVTMTVGGANLSITPASLDFGSITAELQLTLTNTGSSAIDYKAATSNAWIILQKTEGKLTSTDYLKVMVNRESLSSGDYTGSVTIHAGAEDFITPVKMSVPSKDKPSVSIDLPRNITATGATFSGMILAIGKDRITSHGFCWSVSPNPTISNSKSNLGDCAIPKAFESEATGLESGKTYYVRAYAQNSAGISYSATEHHFTTVDPSIPPEVSTGAVSSITTSSAKVGGSVSNLGHTAGVTKHGHVWNISPNPTTSSMLNLTNHGVLHQTGSFTSDLDALSPNTTYYVRAYATNAAGTAYGEARSFKTQATTPQISLSPTSLSTFAASSLAGQSVSVTANVDWTATRNPSDTWITITNGSGNAGIVSSFTVTVATNTVTSQRTGTITVSGGGTTQSITVTQAGATQQGIGGTTGPLTWSFADGTLTISGTGAMPNYSYTGPWYSSQNSIRTVNIDDGVTSIGAWAFIGCLNLTSITIGNSVTTIGLNAFSGCSSLTSITIGNSVTTIGQSAFGHCYSLTSITIPNSVTTIGGSAFDFCESLTSVTIGNSVTTIGGDAFYGCTSLTSITIPNSVTTIGGRAFHDCSSLTSITIGNSVTTIGGQAFWGCSSLMNVTVLRKRPPTLESNTFVYVPLSSATLTVPKGCKAAYQSYLSSGGYSWENFGTIVELEN
jgi:hypothetical protein